MTAYVVRRILLFIPTLFVIALLVFSTVRMIPGDPAASVLADGVTGAGAAHGTAYAAMRERLGLNEPIWASFLDWAGGLLRGDLGHSLRTNEPVSEVFRDRLPLTVELALMSLVVTVVVSLPLGIVSAIRSGRISDYAIRGSAVFFMAVPHFWLAILAVAIPFQLFGYAPPLFYVPLTEDPLSNLRTVLPPVIVMSVGAAAPIIRMTRTNLLEVIADDYVRTAHAKGLHPRLVLTRHALRNALIPTIEIILSRVPQILGGVIVMETVFALPGLGRALVDAVAWRDYTTLQAIVLFNAFLVLSFNLLADLAYAWADPRLRYG